MRRHWRHCSRETGYYYTRTREILRMGAINMAGLARDGAVQIVFPIGVFKVIALREHVVDTVDRLSRIVHAEHAGFATGHVQTVLIAHRGDRDRVGHPGCGGREEPGFVLCSARDVPAAESIVAGCAL